LFTDKTNGWVEVSEVGLDFAVGNGVGLGNAYSVGGIEFETVVTLDAVGFVCSIGRVDEINYTNGAVSNLTLTIDEITSGDNTSLLTVSHSQVKSTDAL
jgi:hypothetical protein